MHGLAFLDARRIPWPSLAVPSTKLALALYGAHVDMRCLKMAAVKYVCCLFAGETKRLSKPIAWKSLYVCVCVCVTVRFGHVHSSSCCQRKVVGKWTCRWRLLLGWMDHKKHASLAYYEMVCEDCKKENMKNNDGKWNIRTKEPMTRGLHYIEKYWIYYMHYNTMLISLYYP